MQSCQLPRQVKNSFQDCCSACGQCWKDWIAIPVPVLSVLPGLFIAVPLLVGWDPFCSVFTYLLAGFTQANWYLSLCICLFWPLCTEKATPNLPFTSPISLRVWKRGLSHTEHEDGLCTEVLPGGFLRDPTASTHKLCCEVRKYQLSVVKSD